MAIKLPFSLLQLVVCFGLPLSLSAHQSFDSELQLGSVVFPVSCKEAALQPAEQGLALLHHMTYEDAYASFMAAAKADPDCAMAYWGAAMTYIHPLWSDPPTESEYQEAKALLEKANQSGDKTAWERDYILALEAYFESDWSKNEKPRLIHYADAWQEVHQKYPDDIEAAALYALAYLGTVEPSDKSYAKQKQSGELSAGLLSQVGDHPGGHHYTIHAYDYPTLAKNALAIARNYGKIAPEIPHALHMPTHIFTREGMWEDSIEWNIRSADAALGKPVNGAISLHYLHALDYLAYAYLQRGEDIKAANVESAIEAIDVPIQTHVAAAYTLAAVPARLALERQQWERAADLEPRVPASYPWHKFPAMEAITYFARALGAARSGRSQQAKSDLDMLKKLKGQLPPSASYWAKQVEIQYLSALAWLQYQTDKSKGLETMMAAAELEASTEKHPVTPGEVLPAHELLADMMLNLGLADLALTKYELALMRSPNRLNSLYGAGFAAEQLGRRELAERYYRNVLALTADADTQLTRISKAKAYLSE